MGRSLRGTIAFCVVVALAVAACGGRKKPAEVRKGPGFTEQGLAAEGSLEKFRTGEALPASDEGPLRDINFAFDSFELDEQAREILKQNAQWLKDNPRVAVEIEGHCDERGTIEYNLALGAKRARAAKEYLVTLGVEPDRLTTISYGEELPLCRESTEECWAKNRRAHFVPLRD
ncbi:MAG: hypothetical protein KatS3mg076_0975 [Candidatus Binatia bacterium]|nr:MAG: hypothetical protein KatS3mg076_0975 [Candidatus Binatia bacterium]